MSIAILATGDEIVQGDTLNTNGQQIAHAIHSEGHSLGLHLSCNDAEAAIVTCLQFLTNQHDIIIIIGGLGPTTDDLTRFALSRFTGEDLLENEEALSHLEQRLATAQVKMNAGNLQQCLFPENVRILPNPYGSAVGCYHAWREKTFILLPGPPRECLPMFNIHVLPLLQPLVSKESGLLKWLIFGVAESEIGQILEDALAGIECKTGYRLDTPYIEFKVRCTHELTNTIQSIVNPILAPHIIAPPNKKASDVLYEFLLSINQPITIIDEATGGILQSILVRPGTHNLIHFNNLTPTPYYFHLSGLTEYWSLQQPQGQTQLFIQYSDKNQAGGESHDIPYRSSNVVLYAAEWLSFRLFHLIKQLL